MSDKRELIDPDDVPTMEEVDLHGIHDAASTMQELAAEFRQTGNPETGLQIAEAARIAAHACGGGQVTDALHGFADYVEQQVRLICGAANGNTHEGAGGQGE